MGKVGRIGKEQTLEKSSYLSSDFTRTRLKPNRIEANMEPKAERRISELPFQQLPVRGGQALSCSAFAASFCVDQ